MKSFKNGYYLGPDIEQGPLPTLFYFALSAEESLSLDPYNQPARFFEKLPVRVFSLNLPAHGPGLPALDAMSVWAKEIALGHDMISSFVEDVHQLYDALIEEGALKKEQTALAGLSRGAFIASHVAASLPEIPLLLGFAPLTQLTHVKEFQEKELSENPLAEALNLSHLTPHLYSRTIRFYIGNLDKRVGTRACFDWIENLSQAAFERKIRSPKIELIISASIGHQGHGTSKEVFEDGALWICNQWGVLP